MKYFKRFYTLGILSTLLFCNTLYANFNPAKLQDSVVRITIKGGGQSDAGATGFFWQSPNQIVTSLHAMRFGSDVTITVEQNKVKRLASVDRILKNADLVLLKLDGTGFTRAVPLTNLAQSAPNYRQEMMALGFNSGAPTSSTRQLKKGYINPEILKSLLPPKDLIEIKASGMPDVGLAIYYLEGSLLPGFSGSPIVNDKGELFGIGDGGLENGASNVSWVIPASNLKALLASKERTLSEDINAASQSFSADIGVSQEDNYTAIEFGNYYFVKTKTRTFKQLLASTDDPDGLNEIANSFYSEFNLGYLDFEYDIYEDVTFGLIIAVPTGLPLVIDEDGNLMGDYGEESPYEINYIVQSADEFTTSGQSAESILNALADQYLVDQNDEGDKYVEPEGVRKIELYGENKYVLRSAFNDLHNEEVFDKGVDYITFATNLNTLFLARGVLNRFDNDFTSLLDSMKNVNCSADYINEQQEYVCAELSEMLWIVSSVHLTSFANTTKKRTVAN